MRGDQLSRQWKVLRLIESRRRGVTAFEIAAHLDVGLRTVYRDLDAVQAAGFPIYNERIDKNSFWKLTDGYRSGLPFPFTITELLSLHMSRDLLKVFDGTIFQEGIESLFQKIQTSLPPEVFRFLENVSAQVRVGFGPPKRFAASKDLIAELSKAAARHKRVEICYRAGSTGKVTVRVVDPYQMWAMNGAFYLIGLCHLREAVRTFAADRITSLRVLDESFHYPRDFRLEDYLQTAFRVMTGDPEMVRIRFTPGAARVVRERIWHPTQELWELEDGGLEITLEISINYEVISWILGFGSAAEVLQPELLRRRILEDLEASVARYRSGDLPQTKIIRQKKIRARLT